MSLFLFRVYKRLSDSIYDFNLFNFKVVNIIGMIRELYITTERKNKQNPN